MIYTVTFNPAIDVVISVTDLKPGGINRTASQDIYYGGKGINVSYVLGSLERESVALGFLAGNMGKAFKAALDADGIANDFVMLAAGETRINTKLRVPDKSGTLQETAFNAPGPRIGEEALAAFMDKLARTQDGDVVVVSGAAPKSLGDGVYERLLSVLAGKQVRVVVDAEGELLLNTLHAQPFLIKPNDEELAQIAGCDPDDLAALVECARDLHAKGAQNVLVSRGGKGAFLIDEVGEYHEMDVLKGTLVNSVGAGDSTVAGFVHGYLAAREAGLEGSERAQKAFEMAMACGAATAFSEGLAQRGLIDELLSQIA